MILLDVFIIIVVVVVPKETDFWAYFSSFA